MDDKKRDELIQKIEDGCAGHANRSQGAPWPVHTNPLSSAREGAIMEKCLEAGGVENYKDKLIDTHNGGHGLPQEAARQSKNDGIKR